MAGSIKIQHGATASTPQAGFSTLWVRSSDGQFYYTKPNGSSEPLVGATGATGSAGLGLSAKNFELTQADFTAGGTATIVFAQPFPSTDYSIDVQWVADSTLSSGNTAEWQDLVSTYISNKTASGFDITIGLAIAIYPNFIAYVQAIALGESAVLQTKINPIPPTYATVAAAAAAGLTGGDLFKTSAGMLGVVF